MNGRPIPRGEPEWLRLRPHYRGLPVPFTVQWSEEGIPDFKTIDPVLHLRALKERLCGLCGEKMGREVAFVGGPASATSGMYRDAPSHLECARYAFEVCPFLGGRGYSKIGAAAKSVVSDVRPEKMAIVTTASYRWFTAPTGEVLIARGKTLLVEWWD